MDDKLNEILQNPEKMQAAFEMASKFMNKNNPSAETPKINTNDLAGTLQKMRENGALDSILSGLSSKSASTETEGAAETSIPPAEDTGSGGLSAMLPNLLQMLGGSEAVNPERANLLKAIKPYVNQGRAQSIDRAVNVAGMAKGAKSVLGTFKK